VQLSNLRKIRRKTDFAASQNDFAVRKNHFGSRKNDFSARKSGFVKRNSKPAILFFAYLLSP
jgi:hypothetical protein